MGQQSQVSKFTLPTREATFFDLAPTFLVASGPNCPYLIFKNLTNCSKVGALFKENDVTSEKCFKLPDGAEGVTQLSLIGDRFSLAYISRGNFYLVNLN